MLNAGSTFGTAVLRGVYNALGAGVLSFLTTYQVTDNSRDALIVGAITALGALGFRAGVEGMSDKARDDAGKVRSSDVGQQNR